MAHLIKDKNGNYEIHDIWSIDDIQSVQDCRDGEPLTAEQCNLVMESIAYSFDANIGINWEVVEQAIDLIFDGYDYDGNKRRAA